jgi:hypothetical protein
MQSHHDDLQGKDSESDDRLHLSISGPMQGVRSYAEVWTVLLFGVYQVDKAQKFEYNKAEADS